MTFEKPRDESNDGVSHGSMTRRGEDVAKQESEHGRERGEPKGATDRPTGRSSGRDVTGIDPQDPIHERSTHR
jgi:hypothetical protein